MLETLKTKHPETKAQINYSPLVRRLAVGLAFLGVLGCEQSSSSAKDSAPAVSLESGAEVLNKFNFTNSFSVDKAQLNPEAQMQIRAEVTKFLEAFNNENKFKNLLRARTIIESSADERPTTSWAEAGNQALSEARLIALDSLLRSILNEFHYDEKIPDAELSRFKRKNFIKVTPAGTWGKGFLPNTELINPATGKNYTPEELKKLDPKSLQSLYDQARYARVTVEIPGGDEQAQQYQRLVEVMTSYDKVTLLLDRSSSMRDDYHIFAKKISSQIDKISGQNPNDTAVVVPFEAGADIENSGKVGLIDLPKTLEKLRLGGGNERAFASLDQVLQTVENSRSASRQAIVVLTDEGVQDFSLATLDKVIDSSKGKNCDVYFGLLGSKGLISFVDAPGLKYEIENFFGGLLAENYIFPEGMNDAKARHAYLYENLIQIQLDKDNNLLYVLNRAVREVVKTNALSARYKITEEAQNAMNQVREDLYAKRIDRSAYNSKIGELRDTKNKRIEEIVARSKYVLEILAQNK